MSSLTYDSFWDDKDHGNIIPSGDSYYAMLVTSAYTPDKAVHSKRSDITNEVAATGYTAGGVPVTCTITKDTVNARQILTFAAISIPNSTITARGAVYYKHRGGAATADELVAYDDFGSDQISSAANFNVAASTITIQN